MKPPNEGKEKGIQPTAKEPALPRRLLSLFLGREAATEALRTLDELYHIKAHREGGPRARRWYWRQTLAFALRHRAARAELSRRPGATQPMNTPEKEEKTVRALLEDARSALRTLRKAPGFSLVAIVTLGLGIGVTLAMAGILQAALLRPLPFPQADRLVIGRATWEGRLNPWVAAPDFLDYRADARGFEGMAALLPFPTEFTVTGEVNAERIMGTTVSPGFFRTLGVVPEVGRTFLADEGAEGAPEVAVLSHGFWVRRFGGDPEVVGRTLRIDDTPHTVVGIMPRGFHFLIDVDFWRPMRPDRDAAALRDRHNWFVVGRLGQGTTLDQAQVQVDIVSRQLQEAYPETNAAKALLLTDLRSVLVEDHRTKLGVLSAAAVLVLLIACANVTGMLLARAPGRARELSIRAALGAGQGRLIRGLLLESVILAGVGGLLGIALSYLFQGLALDYLSMDRLGLESVGISLPLLLFALGLSLAAGLGAGLYPCLRVSRRSLSQELKEGARHLGGGGTVFRSGLVVAQITISVLLLVGSGLLLRSFALKQAVDPGFDPANRVTAEVQLPPARYPRGAPRSQFFSELAAELRALPGVSGVSAVSHLPIRHPRNTFLVRETSTPESGRSVFLRSVLPEYFQTMTIPLVAGRAFSPADGPEGPPVAILNRTMAEAFFPDQNPIGSQVELDYFGTPRPLEVVGVVEDVRISGLAFDPESALYLPHAQFAARTMQLVVRVDGNPRPVMEGMRAALRRMDPGLPLAGLTTLEEVVEGSVAEDGLVAAFLTFYALLPLLLAAVGLYAVMASYVAQRLHEIGIRITLGADPSRIGAMVVGRGVWLVSIGLVVGLAAAFALTRFLEQILFGVAPTDVATFAGVAGLVAAVALGACLGPTVRAVRSDPKEILQTG